MIDLTNLDQDDPAQATSDWGNTAYPAEYQAFRRDWARMLDAMLTGDPDDMGLRGGLAATAAADVLESEQDLRVWLDLPGVDPESVTLSIDGDCLHVDAHRGPPEADEPPLAWRREQPSGGIRRSIRLPFEPEETRIAATLANDVLLLTIGKPETSADRDRTRLR